MTPSFTSSTLSKREVNDADAFGNSVPFSFRARFPAGDGAGLKGGWSSLQASNSVRPVTPFFAWVKTTRTFSVSSG